MEGVNGAFCRLEKVAPSPNLAIWQSTGLQASSWPSTTCCLASGFCVPRSKNRPPAAFHFWLRLWLPELITFPKHKYSGRVPLGVSSRTSWQNLPDKPNACRSKILMLATHLFPCSFGSCSPLSGQQYTKSEEGGSFNLYYGGWPGLELVWSWSGASLPGPTTNLS